MPVIASVAVNWTGSKNFGIGEPLNSAEKTWTVTVTYQGGRTETIEANNAEIEWTPADFSATAGTNKTVTVRYKEVPATAAITGITVRTLQERVQAVPNGGTATIYLYADENVGMQWSDNRTITLLGVKKPGSQENIKIGRSTGVSIPIDIYNAHIILGANVTLDGSIGVASGQSFVRLASANARFTMKEGSMITGNNASNGGAVVVQTGTFDMEGGTITGNSASLWGGGVQVLTTSATFNMSGGIISGNTSLESGGGVSVFQGATFNMSGGSVTENNSVVGKDVFLNVQTDVNPGRIYLSGNAQIDNIALNAISYGGASHRAVITISSNTFSGSVGSVDLGGYTTFGEHNYLNNWMFVQVISAGAGVTLTKAILEKFTLGEFITSTGAKAGKILEVFYSGLAITWWGNLHLYGTGGKDKDGTIYEETVQEDFGKLMPGYTIIRDPGIAQ